MIGRNGPRTSNWTEPQRHWPWVVLGVPSVIASPLRHHDPASNAALALDVSSALSWGCALPLIYVSEQGVDCRIRNDYRANVAKSLHLAGLTVPFDVLRLKNTKIDAVRGSACNVQSDRRCSV